MPMNRFDLLKPMPDDVNGKAVMSKWPRLRYCLHPLIASTVLLGYVGWLHGYFPAREEISYVSLAFKGCLTAMGIAGMFLLGDVRKAEYQAYIPLFAGILCFAFAFSTDSMAELVRTTIWVKIIGERMLLLVGFALVLRGLYLWSRHTLQINEKLARLATTDELTGVANRRQLMHELKKQTALASRQSDNLISAIMFDVDHFKRINDEHGHEEGDRVLKDITRLANAELRIEDTLARIGGEEFVVLLPSTGLSGATQSAERLREAIKKAQFGATEHASASFGVAVYQPGEPIAGYLKRLDLAVYKSKKAGRDQVTVDLS
jgi:diguanylate cyclase (GGDEF)-like protein